MRVLGLETASRAVSVALVDGEEVLAETWLAASQQHCRRLIPMVDWCLSNTGLTLEAIEGFSVSLGPGSFTGLKIGVATAKALAQVTGKGLVGISTFMALAAGAEEFEGLVCPVLPSRPGEIYAAFLRRRNEEWHHVEPPVALSPGDLPGRLPLGEERVLLIGEGASQVAREAGGNLGPRISVATPLSGRLLASQVASLGHKRLLAGSVDDLWGMEPYYFRPPGAAVKGR